MKPIDFYQSNETLIGPKDSDVVPLPVWRDSAHVLSCWKLSLWERVKIMMTGKVWLWVEGKSHPPVLIDTDNPWSK